MLLALAMSAVWTMPAAATPGGAADGVALMEIRAGSLDQARRSSTRALPRRAQLLGATWRGPADAVEVRERTTGGAWSAWVVLEALPDGPDPGSTEDRASKARSDSSRAASAPIWVGDAEQVQVRAHEHGVARDVRIVAVHAPRRSGDGARGPRTARIGSPAFARVQPRSAWGAAAPRVEPELATDTGVLGAVIHHTASTNRYACTQVPALLRGIQRYHMRVNGWNDIGYNFLVDACGGVWEGRGGGTTRPVVGAHAAGFNTATTGIALLGTHSSVRPTPAARSALQRLVAWRLDIAHVNPTGRMTLTARTGDKYALGSRVTVRAVSGHRDLFPTSCPGALGYRELNTLAAGAWRTGGVKVANITRSHQLRAPDDPLDPTLHRVSVRAIGSAPDTQLSIRLERVSTGELLHAASVVGPVISTTWIAPTAAQVPEWDVHVVVDGVRGEQRARRARLPLVAVSPDPGFVVTIPPPSAVTLGADPATRTVQLQYTLAQPYRLGAWLHDPGTGEAAATLHAPDYVGTPSSATPLDLVIPSSIPPGSYELRVGLAADTARGRSMRRYPLVVAAE